MSVWVSRFGPSSVGGVEYVLRNAITAGSATYVICMAHERRILPRKSYYEGVPVLTLGRLGRIGRVDLNISVTLVVLFVFLFSRKSLVFNLPFVQLMPLMLLRSSRVKLFLHGFSSTGLFGRIHKFVLLRLSHGKRLIVTSRHSAQLCAEAGLQSSILPLCLAREDEDALLRVCPTESDYVLFIGRYAPYKGLESLQQAALKLHGAGSDMKIVCVGSGTEALHGGALDGRGFVTREEKLRLIAGCRALVLPSVGDGEGFGLVQLEALAAGKQVIVSELSTGIHKVAGPFAKIFPPGDSDALTHLIQNLSACDSDAARDYYITHYSYKTFESRVADVLD